MCTSMTSRGRWNTLNARWFKIPTWRACRLPWTRFARRWSNAASASFKVKQRAIGVAKRDRYCVSENTMAMEINPATQAIPQSTARAVLGSLYGGLNLGLFRHSGALRSSVNSTHFIVIAVALLASSGAWSFALSGSGALFNPQALASQVLWVPLALLAGHLVARVLGDDRYLLQVGTTIGTIGIALSIVSGVVWFAVDHGWVKVPALLGVNGIYDLLFAWWALAIVVAVRRLTFASRHPTLSPILIVALIVVVPMYFLTPEPLWDAPGEEPVEAGSHPFGERALYAQPELLRKAEQRLKPERAGVEDLYFIGFAPDASQDVFMKETLAISRLVNERFGADGRGINLISHPGVVETLPIATLTSLRHALHAIGSRMNAEEDVVLLHLTSHGSENHQLSVAFYPLELRTIGPDDLRSALDDAGIKWRIVVISACYAGGFISALQDTHTLVITASDATHTSFGCGNAFDFTYFSKAYFDEALRHTYSFEKAFSTAQRLIAARERQEGLEASNPQMALGHAIQAKLSNMANKWSEAAHEK